MTWQRHLHGSKYFCNLWTTRENNSSHWASTHTCDYDSEACIIQGASLEEGGGAFAMSSVKDDCDQQRVVFSRWADSSKFTLALFLHSLHCPRSILFSISTQFPMMWAKFVLARSPFARTPTSQNARAISFQIEKPCFQHEKAEISLSILINWS